jgi:hypothetical protein
VLVGLLLLGLSVAQAVYTGLQVDVSGVPVAPWKARTLVAALNYLGPFLRAIERNKVRVQGLSEVERIRFPRLRQKPDLDLARRSFILSYWNETGLEKEACISAVVDFLRPRKYPVILDNGWEPWDVSISRGIWVRAEMKFLIQNHGGNKRQVDVGVSLRTTAFAKAILALLGVGTLLSIVGGWPMLAVELLAAMAGTASFLAYQAYRLGRTVWHAVEITFQSLPLDPLKPEKNGALPQG